MKRKADSDANGQKTKSALKKRAKTILSDEDIRKCFRKGLFDKEVLNKYTKAYAASEPYKHSVIETLIDDELLRAVRNEIKENVEFTPKETDIYRIHQSGDLANLDGLDDAALEKLPSLLRLRDAIYSAPFRKYASTVTNSGPLSGRKTDMAINVYTPGCHLLCHDDVIGSRRISYILYLVDPDLPWKTEFGGALRLFPTKTYSDDGVKTITPLPDITKIVPPAWNQLSFFAVQPGLSFHDVEEVYHAESKEQLEKDGGRIRMAISGWFHIPQIGEEGYVKGEEEAWGKNSSLKQLQGHPDRYDFPKAMPVTVEPPAEEKEPGLQEEDLDFLLKYMAPTYLTPDTLEEVAERFMDSSSVTLDGLLSNKFSARVREYIEAQEKVPLSEDSAELEKGAWKVARPPHKHRFLYLQPGAEVSNKGQSKENPIKELLEVFLPSPQFRNWLELATQCDIENFDLLARRFRRGLDYSLATGHDGEARLEIGLGLTPTPGWGDDEVPEEEEEEVEEKNGSSSKKGKGKKAKSNGKKKEEVKEPEEELDIGGHEVYMAGEDDDADGDAAVYQASSEAEDDNVLFTMPASWNKMSIVLRDSGVLKFVKYVSKSAKGDRWDICGAFGVKPLEDEEGEEEGEEAEEEEEETSQDTAAVSLTDSEEEVFNGFPDSSDSDSE